MKTKTQSEVFCIGKERDWEDLGGGVQRQIMGFVESIMMVKVRFAKGSIGKLHDHFHSQVTFCAEGKFNFTIGNETREVVAGDVIYMQPDIPHSALCLEEGMLIDTFSPVRQDFLDGSAVSYFGDK